STQPPGAPRSTVQAGMRLVGLVGSVPLKLHATNAAVVQRGVGVGRPATWSTSRVAGAPLPKDTGSPMFELHLPGCAAQPVIAPEVEVTRSTAASRLADATSIAVASARPLLEWMCPPAARLPIGPSWSESWLRIE